MRAWSALHHCWQTVANIKISNKSDNLALLNALRLLGALYNMKDYIVNSKQPLRCQAICNVAGLGTCSWCQCLPSRFRVLLVAYTKKAPYPLILVKACVGERINRDTYNQQHQTLVYYDKLARIRIGSCGSHRYHPKVFHLVHIEGPIAWSDSCAIFQVWICMSELIQMRARFALRYYWFRICMRSWGVWQCFRCWIV